MANEELLDARDPSATPEADLCGQSENPEATNPHSLGRQITGIVIASLASVVMFGIGAVAIVLAGVFVFLDAWNSGIYKQPGERKLTNMSPMGWGVGAILLLIIAYPLYAFNRNKLKTRKAPAAYWILLHVFAIISLAALVLQVIVGLLGVHTEYS